MTLLPSILLAMSAVSVQQFTAEELLPTPVLPCNPAVVQQQVDPVFASLSLEVDLKGKEVSFTEVRNGIRTTLKEPIQEIGLRVLDLTTCRTEIVRVRQNGDQFTSLPGWDVQPVRQPNGIRWNKWSTDWRVVAPSGWIAIELRYPKVEEEKVERKVRLRTGRISTVYDKVKKVSYYHYFPYNPEQHTSNTVSRGVRYEDQVMTTARQELRSREVYSKAFPGTLVSNVPYLKHEDVRLISAVEWIDWGAFLIDQQWTADYFWIKLGNNGSEYAKYACNKSGACGVKQFTDARGNGTYTTIRHKYPQAGLIADFVTGARDHANVAKAAILLFDNNLAFLIDHEGEKILADPHLSEYLLAMYNASPTKVLTALRRARRAKDADWIVQLPRVDRRLRETQQYILKFRYLRDEYPMSTLTAATPHLLP